MSDAALAARNSVKTKRLNKLSLKRLTLNVKDVNKAQILGIQQLDSVKELFELHQMAASCDNTKQYKINCTMVDAEKKLHHL